MVIRAQVAELKTGDRIQTLPTSNISWEQRILSPESVNVTLTMKPEAHHRIDLRNSTTEAKTALIVSDDDLVLGAGPIWEREYDDESGRWTASTEGIWSLFDRRYILPTHVTEDNLLITSGEDEGEPSPGVRTSFAGMSWPQIVRGLIEQSFQRTGGHLPIVFGPDGVGAHDKSYDASAFKTVGEALRDLTQLQDGPEITFTPRVVNNRLEWLCRVGDDTKLKIESSAMHVFDFTPIKRSVRKLKVKSSGENLASEAWSTGGRQEAVAIFARANSMRLLDAGFPRMETIASDHSTVLEKATLRKYAEADLRAASAPMEWWSWEFHADQSPNLRHVTIGDRCEVVIPKGHRYLPPGPHERRIVALSGDSSSRWVRVTTDEVITW